jgi:hypothetical protein
MKKDYKDGAENRTWTATVYSTQPKHDTGLQHEGRTVAIKYIISESEQMD